MAAAPPTASAGPNVLVSAQDGHRANQIDPTSIGFVTPKLCDFGLVKGLGEIGASRAHRCSPHTHTHP